jgi:hypothetical protein
MKRSKYTMIMRIIAILGMLLKSIYLLNTDGMINVRVPKIKITPNNTLLFFILSRPP